MSQYEELIGQVLDRRYHIVKTIGAGGMSVVFEAMDLMNNRPVAVKILKEEMSRDLQAVKRFINESKAVSLLSHPGIVRIYDVVISNDLKYIVMERVQGITLKSYIEKKGTLSLQEILSYTEQILRALSHAHSRDIVHRDIKPQNILLLKNGRIKVADFGIAKLPGAGAVTMTDKAIGTVSYISPEQASGQPIDPRSDLYSLGVCMYEMATGQLPFVADNPVSVALMQVNEQPRPPRQLQPSIPFGLEQIILGAMEKDPNRRFQDATQMLRHVAQLRNDPAFVFHTKRVRRSEVEHLEEDDEDAPTNAPPSIRRILDPKAVSSRPMKKNRKQSSAMFPIIAGVAVAFLMVCILCGYVLLSAFFEMQEKLRPVEVTVPDLIGEVVSDEILSAYDASLYSFAIVYEKNDDYKVNTVIAQNPNGGTLRKVQSGGEKCLITLTLSRAEDAMILPDFLMVNYRDAEEQLSAKGIVVTCVKEYNGNFSNGQIFRTEPAAGTLLKEGDAVTLYVSRGAIVDLVSVPDFKGKTPLQAYRSMVDADDNVLLSVGKVTYEYSDEYAEGTIMAQSHTPTVMVYPGETIDFVISKGSAPSTQTQEPSDLGPDYLL